MILSEPGESGGIIARLYIALENRLEPNHQPRLCWKGKDPLIEMYRVMHPRAGKTKPGDRGSQRPGGFHRAGFAKYFGGNRCLGGSLGKARLLGESG